MDKRQYHVNGIRRSVHVYQNAKSKLVKKIFGKIVLWHFYKLKLIDSFTWAVMYLIYNQTLWVILGIDEDED